MARRPDLSASAVEETLVTLGHARSMANAIGSDFKIIVPMVLKALGKERVATIMFQAQKDYGLNGEEGWCKLSGEAAVKWAEYVLASYSKQRHSR